MEANPRKILFIGIGILFFVSISVFSYTRFSRYLTGPEIVEVSLEEFTNTDKLSLPFSGRLKNTAQMFINGREAIIDDTAHFDDIIILYVGQTKIYVNVVDDFGKRKDYVYTIYSSATNDDYAATYRKALEQQKLELLELETTSD